MSDIVRQMPLVLNCVGGLPNRGLQRTDSGQKLFSSG
jgi:hypothetical protein